LNAKKRREHVMRLAIGASTILLIFSTAALAQLSPEEAEQRMQDRLAQEKADAGQEAIAATQPSNLTNGQVAQLYKTITQQQNEIAQLTAEVQQLKDKFALSQLNLRNAQTAADAAATAAAQTKDAPNAAANAPAPSDIETAIANRTLVVGMTLDQCNQAIGRPGEITGANGSSTFYEWFEYTYENGVLAPAGYKGPVTGMLPFTGTIENGKLVNFDKGLWKGM
jgi:hypothetical protein